MHDGRTATSTSSLLPSAYALDPEYIDHDHAGNKEVTEGLLNTVEKMGILFVTRQLQEKDGRFADARAARAELIEGDKNKQKTLEHYPKYPTRSDPKVKEFCTKVNAQLALYRGKKGIFSREWVFDSAEDSSCRPTSSGTSTAAPCQSYSMLLTWCCAAATSGERAEIWLAALFE